MAALFVDPAMGLVLVTLRAGAIAARVIGENLLLAVIALMDVTAKERCAAGGDIAQSLLLNRAQVDARLLSVGRAMEALDALGVPADRAVAFEDSPNGVRSAKAAGLYVVAVPNWLTEGASGLEQADEVLASLADYALPGADPAPAPARP